MKNLFCTQDMGLNTDCGDDASTTRDGFALCPTHAAHFDAMVRNMKKLERQEKAYEKVHGHSPFDEDAALHCSVCGWKG